MESFKDVVGHEDVIQYIRTAIAQDQVSHAYILNGARGAGKRMLAKLFALTLNCENSRQEPCGHCAACKQIENGNHPDVIRLRHEKPNTISVDDVREQLNNTIAIKPYKSDYKVYIVEEAELMSVQAQNAILKTLEEPPAYAVILLLTENVQSLLPTITSRCVMLKLRNIKDTLIRRHLMERLGVPDYRAKVCAAFSQGNLGQAIMLAKSEYFNEILETALGLLRHVRELEMAELLETLKKVAGYKLEINDFLDIIMIWYRDVLLYKATQDIDRVIFKDELSALKETARRSSYEGIETVLNGLDRAKSRLAANVNFELVMELLFLTMKEN